MSERSLVRADLLVALENAGAVTPTELHLPDGIALERVEAVGAMLGQLGSAVRWWAGDYLVHVEEHFGPLAAQLSEALGMSPEGRQECVRVALAFPPSRRRPGLSFGHHRACAARWTDPHRERLLDIAEGERLSTRELEAHVRHLRETLEAGAVAEVEAGASSAAARALHVEASGTPAATDCAALVDEVLADLHADLLDCGFGDRLVVTVEVASATVGYRVSFGPEEAAA